MSETDSSNLVGQTLADGRYELISLLAEGSSYRVYRGKDAKANREVVIKFPRSGAEFAAHGRKLLRYETERNARIAHPHIISILDAGEYDGLPFVVYPYMQGGSLRDRMRSADKGPQQISATREQLQWLPQIAAALDYLHGQQLVHRDVQPANIVFDSNGRSFLTGLNLARRMTDTDLDDDEQLLGRLSVYWAPEFLVGQTPLTGAADQYSLAVTLYEFLAGQRPYREVGARLFQEVIGKEPTRLDSLRSDLPRQMVEVVHRAMAKSPGERFPTCTAFAQAVMPVLMSSVAPTQMRTVCPHCDAEILVAPYAVGKNVICPFCKSRLRVPSPQVETKPAAPARDAASPMLEQAPAPTSLPSAASVGKSRQWKRTSVDDFDDAAPEPETRRATVRYYQRMNPMRLFPFLVIFSKEMIQQISKRGTDQRASGPFQVDTEAPVDVEPVLPGCTCHPPKITTKLKSDTDSLVFYVVPNVIGKIQGGKVVVTQNHATLAEVPLKMKVVQRTWFYISCALTVILPFFSALSKHFGWDFETQMDTGFELYLKAARLVFNLVSPYMLAGILAMISLVAYWMTRPRKKDMFWEIKPVH